MFPAAVAEEPRTVVPLAAGPGGYLRYEQGLGQFWTTYEGVTTPVRNEVEGPEADGTYGAGSDVVAALQYTGLNPEGRVRLWDVTKGRNDYLTVPRGHRHIGTYGSVVATYTRASSTVPPEWHLLKLLNGTVQDTTVTGWPEAATRPVKALAGGADGIISKYQLSGTTRPLWIDISTAQVRTLPAQVSTETASVAHTPQHLVEWTEDGKATFYAKAGDQDSGPLPVTSKTDLPYAEGDMLLGVVGERLIVGRSSGQGGSAPYRLVSVPREGGDETTLFAYGRSTGMPTPDGGLLVVGGSTAGGLGVQLLRPGAEGVVVGKLTDVTPLSSKPRSLSFSDGQLDAVERMPDERNAFRSRTVSVTGALTAGDTAERGNLGVALEGCTDSTGCPEIFAVGDGRMVVQPTPTSEEHLPVVVEPGADQGRPLTSGFEWFQVHDVSGRYAVGSGGFSDGTYTGVTAIDLDTGKRLGTFDVGIFDFDLYGDTLWAAGKTNGTVTGYDVRTGAVKRTVDLRSGCRAESIKVAVHWLSWTCAGLPAKGGVFDLDKNTNLHYTEPFSKLGDGYVVQETTGSELQVIDVRGPEPVVNGTYRLSEHNDETGPFAVDTAAGRLAYQDDATGSVRVVDLGIPASPLARIDADVPPAQAVDGGRAPWKPRWWLSKPAASWELVIKNKTTGSVVRTLNGGEARGVIRAAWDGKDAGGRLVANGAYAWELSAAPADGAGPALQQAGTIDLTGGFSLASGKYQPLTPTRLMDTRTGLGVPKAKVGPKGTVTLQAAGVGGVPATGATAVVMNVTATNPTALTYVSVYPAGTQRTSASNLNLVAQQTAPNLVVVPVVNGKVSFYNNAGSVDLIADIAGYYAG